MNANSGIVSAQLAARCDDLAPPDPGQLEESTAPPGTILAVNVAGGEIHRFTTTGIDLEQLPLPSEVRAPIRYLTLHPDGQHLAFLAGTAPAALWVVDLDTGAASSSTAPTCMDWESPGTDLWAFVGTPPDDFIARIQIDGTFDQSSRLSLDGCPYRYDADRLAVSRPRVDGGPPQIDLVAKTEGAPLPLVTSSCSLVGPRISPNSKELLLTAGCRTDARSGVYVSDADGKRLRQLARGVGTAATWSPDGTWFTYGAYSPDAAGDGELLRVIISSTDGEVSGVVTPAGYSWPIWIAE